MFLLLSTDLVTMTEHKDKSAHHQHARTPRHCCMQQETAGRCRAPERQLLVVASGTMATTQAMAVTKVKSCFTPGLPHPIDCLACSGGAGVLGMALNTSPGTCPRKAIGLKMKPLTRRRAVDAVLSLFTWRQAVTIVRVGMEHWAVVTPNVDSGGSHCSQSLCSRLLANSNAPFKYYFGTILAIYWILSCTSLTHRQGKVFTDNSLPFQNEWFSSIQELYSDGRSLVVVGHQT